MSAQRHPVPPSQLLVVSMLVAVVLAAGGCALLPPSIRDALATPGPAATPEPALTPVPGNLDADLEAHEAAWQASAIDRYQWEVTYSCFCPVSGPVRISVVDGTVASITPVDGTTNVGFLQDFPLTVDDLYARIHATITGGGTAQLTWGDGDVPASATLDPLPQAMDDELYITVSSFAPIADPGPS